MLREYRVRSEQQSKYIEQLEGHRSGLRSELSLLRKWNHYLRRQSLVKFVSREHSTSLALGAQAICLPARKATACPILDWKTEVQGDAPSAAKRPSAAKHPLAPSGLWLPNLIRASGDRLRHRLAKHLGALEQYQPRPLKHRSVSGLQRRMGSVPIHGDRHAQL